MQTCTMGCLCFEEFNYLDELDHWGNFKERYSLYTRELIPLNKLKDMGFCKDMNSERNLEKIPINMSVTNNFRIQAIEKKSETKMRNSNIKLYTKCYCYGEVI